MWGLGAVLVLASIVHGQWFCSCGLVLGQDTPHAAIRMDFTLSQDGAFDATGTVMPLGEVHRFHWSGAWTLADGQLAMIGKTRGRTFGVAPAGELRAIATVTHADVIVRTLSSDAAPGRTMRCLTYPIE